MGGGRSGLFPGTKGADMHQESLFPEPIGIRHRGITYLPVGEAITGGSSFENSYPLNKLHVLTVKEILRKFMDYRFGKTSESELVRWIQNVLADKHYYIETALKRILTKGAARLKNAKSNPHLYNRELFLAELEKIEAEIIKT